MRPTNKTNLASRSEAEKNFERLAAFDKEIDKEEKARVVVKPTLDHARDGGIF
jgi:hypothetical protein